MNTKTNKNQSVKLVMVAGMLVPADKVQGRINALRAARERKALHDSIEAKRIAEETDELLKKGYTMTEVICLRHANRIKQMEAQGFGVSMRCRVGQPNG